MRSFFNGIVSKARSQQRHNEDSSGDDDDLIEIKSYQKDEKQDT